MPDKLAPVVTFAQKITVADEKWTELLRCDLETEDNQLLVVRLPGTRLKDWE